MRRNYTSDTHKKSPSQQIREKVKIECQYYKKPVKDDLNVKFFNVCFTRKYINLASLHTRIWFLFHVEWFYVEQGTLGIKNGPVSKFNEISKIAQQHFTCFRTLNFIQMYQFVFLLQLFKQSIVLGLN